MTEAIIFAAAAVILGGLLGRASWYAVVMFAFLLASIAGMGLSALGQPKPLWLGCGLNKEATVLGFEPREGVAIYLWLQTDGAPLSCALPWDEKEAAQLYDAAELAAKAHAALKAKLDGNGEGKPGGALGTKDSEKQMFYPEPQQSLPDKQGS